MGEVLSRTGPVAVEERLTSLDVARGIALCGILLMNITGFGLPMAYSNPTVYGGATGPDLWSWIVTTMFFEGTQRGIFSLLYGAGIVLMTDSLARSSRPNAQDLFFRRTLWLVVFGLVHAYVLLWVGEILFFYGATALFVYGLRHAQTRTLVGIAVGGLLLQGAWNFGDTRSALQAHEAFVAADSVRQRGDSLSGEQKAAVERWEGMLKEFTPDSTKIAEDVAAKRGGYTGIVAHQFKEIAHWQSWGLYRFFFDIFSMMLLGIVALRSGMLTGRLPVRTYLLLMLGGYGIGLTVNYWEVQHILAGEFSLLAFRETDVTYDLGRLALTAGHLGSILLFCKSGALQWLQNGLAALGRMAFTNYISHSIICAFVFYGFGFGLYGQLQRHELYCVVFGIWLSQLVLSPLWLSRYRFGPLEWLWRWLTYGERPPMRKAAVSAHS